MNCAYARTSWYKHAFQNETPCAVLTNAKAHSPETGNKLPENRQNRGTAIPATTLLCLAALSVATGHKAGVIKMLAAAAFYGDNSRSRDYCNACT